MDSKPTQIMCFAFSPLPLNSSSCQIIVIFHIFLDIHVYYYTIKKNIHKCKSTRLETYGLLGLVFNTTFNTFQWGQFHII
jgi:hypothetical protein